MTTYLCWSHNTSSMVQYLKTYILIFCTVASPRSAQFSPQAPVGIHSLAANLAESSLSKTGLIPLNPFHCGWTPSLKLWWDPFPTVPLFLCWPSQTLVGFHTLHSALAASVPIKTLVGFHPLPPTLVSLLPLWWDSTALFLFCCLRKRIILSFQL
jgi:hypothetical protein